MRAVLVILVSICALPSAQAQDVPPKEDVNGARKLARQAKRVAKEDWGEASKLLARAEELHQLWLYPYELAKGHHSAGMLPLAWRAMRRAEMYGVPNNKRRRFDQLVDKLELALLEGHAFIELLGVPENADVRINGEQWLEPHNKWVPRNFSSIVIIHPEYVRHVFNWHHVRGKQHTRELEMIAASEYGRITITGSPSGAAVLLDGAHIGRLPSITTKLLKPGRYPVKVEHAPEFQASSQFVTVEAGGTTRVSIELEPAVSAFVKLLETKKFWGWTSAVTGGVLTITGAALLGVASGKAADARDLNARHDSGFPEYEERFDAAVDGVQGLQTGGHVMLWVGLAMAGAGATLLVVDSLQVQGEVQAPVSWQIVPAPTGASAIVRF